MRLTALLMVLLLSNAWAGQAPQMRGTPERQQQVTQEQNKPKTQPAVPVDSYVDNSRYAEQSNQGPSNWLDKLFTDPIATFSALLFVATVVLGYVGFRQERWLRQAFRPKIRVKHVWLSSDILSGEEITVRLVIINHGDTPGVIGAIRFVSYVKDYEDWLPDALLDGSPGTYVANNQKVLNGGYTLVIGNLSDHKKLTPAENAGIRNGSKRLHCVGDIEYTDKWGKVMKTAFHRRLDFPRYPMVRRSSARFLTVTTDADYEYQD